MKRSKAGHDDGSLELLLDTICNTFGGIIFISLLLFILINTTSKSASSGGTTSSMAASQLIESETKRETLANELARMRSAEEAQQSATGVLASDELIENAQRLETAEATHAQRLQDKSAAVGSASRAQIEINELEAEAAAKRRQLEEAQKQAAALKTKLTDTLKRRSRGAAAPKQTTRSLRNPPAYLLQYGRLYGPIMMRGQRNTTDFTYPVKEGITFVQPLQSRGLPIAINGSNIAQIRSKLLIGGREPFMLFVWEDSFAAFSAIRVAKEENRQDVAIKFCTRTPEVYFTDEEYEPFRLE